MAGNKRSKRQSAGHKKKIQTNTPITIRYSNKDSDRLKFIPYQALEKFREDQGSLDAWQTLRFRLLVGLELAKKFFTEEADQCLQEADTAMVAIRNRFLESDRVIWHASLAEIELLRMGLEATDDMQDKTTRSEQLTINLRVNECVNKEKVEYNLVTRNS